MVLRVRRAVYRRMLAHARSEAPREAVGLLLGRGDRASRLLELANVSERPRQAYRADPAELLGALRHADEEELEVLAVYHSHPRGPARPSPTDLREAVWRTVYVIVGLQPEEVRAYRLPSGEEVELIVG